jgi:hypothetical protein
VLLFVEFEVELLVEFVLLVWLLVLLFVEFEVLSTIFKENEEINELIGLADIIEFICAKRA